MTKKWTKVIVLSITLITLLINVGSYGVIETSDARYAEISRQMYISGDYLHPQLLNIHHYHKPPITYQITAFAFHLFGVNAFAARFFLQLALTLQLILVYNLAKTLTKNTSSAFLSAIIYLSFPITIMSTRNLTTDAYLNTFIIISLWAWTKYRLSGTYKFLYLFWLSLALGFLTKGPVVFIVPATFAIVFNTIIKNKNNLNYHHLISWLVFFLIASSWFIYLIAQNHDFFEYFIMHHTIDRFSKDVFQRHEPFWYYFAYIPLIGLPWFLVLPIMLWKNMSKLIKNPLSKALLISIIIPFLFFSVASSKLILYILPLFSLIAILIAHLLPEQATKMKVAIRNVLLIYACLLAVSILTIPFIINGLKLSAPTIALCCVMPILLSLVYLHWRNHTMQQMAFLTWFTALFLIIVSGLIMKSHPLEVNSITPMSEFIQTNHLDNRNVIVYNRRLPSLAFNLNKDIISLYDGDRGLNREVMFENNTHWKVHLFNLQDAKEWPRTENMLNNPSVLLSYKKELPPNLNWISQHYKHQKQMGKWIIYY